MLFLLPSYGRSTELLMVIISSLGEKVKEVSGEKERNMLENQSEMFGATEPH